MRQGEPVRLAVIGDYGEAGQAEQDVADLVKSWGPEFIITVGDNNYHDGEQATIDRNIGQYYHEFIYPYVGGYGAGATVNRFFPTMGNDWRTLKGQPYFDYFALPGNERYYDFVRGPIHFFALDSDSKEPDGNTSTSTQANWLRQRLAASTAPWKIVYFHHAPYASTKDGGSSWMRWPFREWGATAVIAGNKHHYERMLIDGLFYFVNGLGGAEIASCSNTYLAPGSLSRYDEDFGAMLVDADADRINFKFINRAGAVIDTLALDRTAPQMHLMLNPTTVVGGKNATGTVTLPAPAPAAGAQVSLSSGNPAAAVPASVSLAAGAISKTFEVSTNAVASQADAPITASYGSVSGTAALIVAPPALVGLTLTPATLTGSCQTSAGEVMLSGKAPAGGVVVGLKSTNPAATVPASVTVPAGSTLATFNVNASAVSNTATGKIRATPANPNFGTTSVSKSVTVEPGPACTTNTAPTAALTATPTSGIAPLTVMFDASGASDPDAGDRVASYSFSFGDGTQDVTQATPMVSHIYAEAGSYVAQLRVADRSGTPSLNTASANISVQRPPDVNYALQTNGGVASASSTYSSAYPASGANNGDNRGLNWGSGGGWSDATRGVYTDWLQIDFGSSKTISEVRVYTLQDNITSPSEPTLYTTCSLYCIQDFNVLFWDGSQWVSVPGGVIRGNDRVIRVIGGLNIKTVKIRVKVLNARADYSRIVEVVAFGPAGQ